MFTLGQEVYSKKQTWGQASGHRYLEGLGIYKVYESSSAYMVVRKASRRWRCEDCGQYIEKNELHGSAFYTHYCLDCVVPNRPDNVIKNMDKEIVAYFDWATKTFRVADARN